MRGWLELVLGRFWIGFGSVWGWFGDGLGMVLFLERAPYFSKWGWFGDGLGMVLFLDGVAYFSKRGWFGGWFGDGFVS